MEAAWKQLVQQRAAEVLSLWNTSAGLLGTAVASLEQPMHVADAAEVRARLELVLGRLAEASERLANASSAAAAAELLARRAAAESPLVPLPSVQEIPDGHELLRQGLLLLQEARGLADGACDSLERCCGHLRILPALLDLPGLPGVAGFLEGERLVAQASAVAAQDQLGMLGTKAALANWLLR
ncbi:hypothetical protein ACP4OV_022281 [Aristida adscensionis]